MGLIPHCVLIMSGRRKAKKKQKKALYQQIRKPMPPPSFIYLGKKIKRRGKRNKKVDSNE